MSKEICRGISTEDGSWVYGAYSYNRHLRRGFIVNVIMDMGRPYARVVEVYPNSVGQCTGLLDATAWEELPPKEQVIYQKEGWYGRVIFEGDILEAHYDKRFPEEATLTVVTWRNSVIENGHGVGWYIEQRPGFGDPLDRFDASVNKVVGNIHENSDLLGEAWK